MIPTTLQESQTSDRTRFGVRRCMLTLLAATLLVATGNAAAQIPLLPISADSQTDLATPIGAFSATKYGNTAQVCADAYPSVPALPVALPVAVPGAQAGACADADLDQLRANGNARGSLYGVLDPTGLVPTQFAFSAGADADDKELDMDAQTDSEAGQGVLDTITGAVRSVWSTIRGLL